MSVYTTEISDVALVAATEQTILQIRAVTRSALITEWSVSFDGVTLGDTPCLVRLARSTTAATGTTGAANKRVSHAAAATTTVKHTVTVEPTLGDVLETFYVTPNGGLLVMQYPQDGQILVQAGEYLSLIVESVDGGMNVAGWIGWTEV